MSGFYWTSLEKVTVSPGLNIIIYLHTFMRSLLSSTSSMCLWRCFKVPANSCLLSIMVYTSQCNGMCVSAGPDSLRSMLLLGKWLPRRWTGAFHLTVLRGSRKTYALFRSHITLETTERTRPDVQLSTLEFYQRRFNSYQCWVDYLQIAVRY